MSARRELLIGCQQDAGRKEDKIMYPVDCVKMVSEDEVEFRHTGEDPALVWGMAGFADWLLSEAGVKGKRIAEGRLVKSSDGSVWEVVTLV